MPVNFFFSNLAASFCHARKDFHRRCPGKTLLHWVSLAEKSALAAEFVEG
jgi:hypothetical protein